MVGMRRETPLNPYSAKFVKNFGPELTLVEIDEKTGAEIPRIVDDVVKNHDGTLSIKFKDTTTAKVDIWGTIAYIMNEKGKLVPKYYILS